MRRKPTHTAVTSCNYLEFPSHKVLPKPLLWHLKTFTLRMSLLPEESGIMFVWSWSSSKQTSILTFMFKLHTSFFPYTFHIYIRLKMSLKNLIKQLIMFQKPFWSWGPHSCCLVAEGRSPQAEGGGEGCLLLLCSPSFPAHRKLTLALVPQKLQLYLMEHAKSEYGNGYITWATVSTEACAFYILSKTLDSEVLPESHAEHTFFRIFYV